jgi:hypothetical protein
MTSARRTRGLAATSAKAVYRFRQQINFLFAKSHVLLEFRTRRLLLRNGNSCVQKLIMDFGDTLSIIIAREIGELLLFLSRCLPSLVPT